MFSIIILLRHTCEIVLEPTEVEEKTKSTLKHSKVLRRDSPAHSFETTASEGLRSLWLCQEEAPYLGKQRTFKRVNQELRFWLFSPEFLPFPSRSVKLNSEQLLTGV